jgi:transcriptional regulator with XRE-family HTH domain
MFFQSTLGIPKKMSSENRKITRRQIIAARDLLGIEQAELAESLSMFPTSLSRIESGRVKPRQATLDRIVKELERRGIEFINGRGVILKKPGQETMIEPESTGE